jgi:hypothetical protein
LATFTVLVASILNIFVAKPATLVDLVLEFRSYISRDSSSIAN